MSVQDSLAATLANELNNNGSWVFDGRSVSSAVADAGGISIAMTDGTRWVMSITQAADETTFEPDLVWDPSDIEEGDDGDEWYDDLTAELTTFMQKINESGRWHCEARNFGWQHQDGSMNFVAHTGRDFLDGILPKTDCTFKIWLNEKERKITIDNAHHDAPTGGEMYYATPIEEGP